jgi:hypothetical protein
MTKITQNSIICTLRLKIYEIISIKLGSETISKIVAPIFHFIEFLGRKLFKIFNNSYIIGLHVRKPHLLMKGFPMLP